MPHKDPEAGRAYRKRYYAGRRSDPVFLANEKRHGDNWRKRNPEKIKRSQANSAKKARRSVCARAGYLLSRAKLRAREKGLLVTITKEWILERLLPGVCEVSGLPFDISESKRHPLSPSIDRIDCSMGYILGNCRVIALALNVAFSDWGSEETEKIWRAYLAHKDGKNGNS